MEIVQVNGSPSLMRAINAARVLREFRSSGPMSRADLVRATGLSKPTITSIVSYLESQKFLEQVEGPVGVAPSSGAQALQYAYRASRGTVLGIDIGADKTLLVLADLSGTTLGRARLNTRLLSPFGPPRIIEEIAVASKKLLDEVGESVESLLSVVVGTPGVVSREGIVTMAPQLKGWEGLNLGAALSAIFSCSVVVEGEVALSLQAERGIGVARGINDALFVHIGVGVGAGLLIDGRIYRGADGGAGEIGMMPLPQVDTSGQINYENFESQTGGGALLSRGQILASTPAGVRLLELAGGKKDDVDASVVFAAMRSGDKAATDLVLDLVSTLAWGISCLVCALNPQTIIIGGGFSRAADLFLPHLQKQVAASVPFAPDWLVSNLGDEAVALGAVNRATEIVEQNMFVQRDIQMSN